MRTKFKALLIVFTGLLFCMKITSCSTIHIKTTPEYTGVDPKLQPLVNEYQALAKIQGIVFKNDVTIGFTKIKDNEIIGLCTYGRRWREIDIDINYYNSTSSLSKLILLFHELTHCYCGRDHDYGEGTKYKKVDEVKKTFFLSNTIQDGFYPDYCPISIMYPIILDDRCTRAHYGDYIVEMFHNCSHY